MMILINVTLLKCFIVQQILSTIRYVASYTVLHSACRPIIYIFHPIYPVSGVFAVKTVAILVMCRPSMVNTDLFIL